MLSCVVFLFFGWLVGWPVSFVGYRKSEAYEVANARVQMDVKLIVEKECVFV